MGKRKNQHHNEQHGVLQVSQLGVAAEGAQLFRHRHLKEKILQKAEGTKEAADKPSECRSEKNHQS